METERKSFEDHIRKLSTELSSLVETDSELLSQLENLTKQFNEREEIVSKRMITSKLYEEKQRDISDAKQKEEDLLKELSEIKNILEAKETRLSECKKQKNDIDHLRKRNDNEEEEILAPSKNAYPKLLEEKETLARTITELHDCSASEKQAFEEKKQSNIVVLSNLESAYQEKHVNVETKKRETAKMMRQLEELNVATKNEIEEQKKLSSDLNEALTAQRAIIDENRQQCRKKVEMTEREWSQRLKRGAYEVDILKQGADVICKTKEAEHHIMESEMNDEN